MAIEVLLIREGTRLAAADPVSHESIQGMRNGEIVTASIRRQRNPRHHAKLFALLGVVQPHSTFPTVQHLLQALKLATGLFDEGRTVDGIPFVAPSSISFAAMCQSEFEQVYERMIEVITTKILPTVNRADLEQQVNDILAGRTHE